MSNWTDLSLIPSGMSLEAAPSRPGCEGAGTIPARAQGCAVERRGRPAGSAGVVSPATVRHFWIAFRHAVPEELRALHLEIFYDGLAEPSVSVPLLDFFGLPHGRFAEYYSAISSSHEGRSISTYLPIPVHRDARIEVINRSDSAFVIYYQLTWTTGELDPAAGYLHATFRRENPTTKGRFSTVSADRAGLPMQRVSGPFPPRHWYGEGEVSSTSRGDSRPTAARASKIMLQRMGPRLTPGIGQFGPPSGRRATTETARYRPRASTHGPDPVPFEREIKVTIQQMGTAAFPDTKGRSFTGWRATAGWLGLRREQRGPLLGGLYERVDDYRHGVRVLQRTAGSPRTRRQSRRTASASLTNETGGAGSGRQLDQYLFEHWGSIAAPLPPAH